MKIFNGKNPARKILMFESDDEIKEWIKELKKMRKNKVSIQWYFDKKFSLHNGKPSIPDYQAGFFKNELLRNTN